jgi:hypothetical protein
MLCPPFPLHFATGGSQPPTPRRHPPIEFEKMLVDVKTIAKAVQSPHVPSKRQADFLTEPGARLLAAKIRKYWIRKGHHVAVEVVCRDGHWDGCWDCREPGRGGVA